jgi:glycosyltransferase involved in cell wall biosynthesis
MVHISVLMMVKNEKERLHVTLNSIKGFADSLIIFDTGSTDNTIEIARTFCEENRIPFRLKEGEFVNFAISRNVSLEFADTFNDVDYLVLLDCNDEVQGGDFLRKYCEEYINNPSSGFLLCQEWFSGSHDKYFNVRLIKPRHEWKYHGSVHEYIKTSNEEFDKHPIVKLPDNVIIYQDRTQDDDKSGKRFKRDKELLLKDYEIDPKETRTLFYLAQTCSCLDEKEEALKYYLERSELDGFQEEKFHAYLRAGEISQKLGKPWHECFVLYWKAFEHSSRVEPLLFSALYYLGIKNWIIAFTFIKLACSLQYPTDSILFVNRNDYDYKRWHLLGIVSFYVGQYDDGRIGCLNAIQYCKNAVNCKTSSEIDEKNLKFYEEKQFEMNNKHIIQQTNNNNDRNHLQTLPSSTPNLQQNDNNINKVNEILTKKQFIEMKTKEVREQFPKYSNKKVNETVNNMWKNRQKT